MSTLLNNVYAFSYDFAVTAKTWAEAFFLVALGVAALVVTL